MDRNASGVKILDISDDDSLIGVVRQPNSNNGSGDAAEKKEKSDPEREGQ